MLHTIKKTVSITLSVYHCFNNFWRINITCCVIRSPADYMAEWESRPLDPKTKKKKQRVDYEPHRPIAARLINNLSATVHTKLSQHSKVRNVARHSTESTWTKMEMTSFAPEVFFGGTELVPPDTYRKSRFSSIT